MEGADICILVKNLVTARSPRDEQYSDIYSRRNTDLDKITFQLASLKPLDIERSVPNFEYPKHTKALLLASCISKYFSTNFMGKNREIPYTVILILKHKSIQQSK